MLNFISRAVRLSFEAISWACRQRVGKSSVKFVLIALANHADAQGFAWPSISHISETTEQDRKTVVAALATLRESGFLIDTGDKKGSTKQVTVYQLMVGNDIVNSAENGIVKDAQKRDSSESGTVPEKTVNSTVSPHKQSQKRDTEPSRTNKEPKVIDIRPDDVDQALWDEWKAHRKAKRSAVTVGVLKSLRAEAEKLNWSLDQVLRKQIDRGWTGFEADWCAPSLKTGNQKFNGSSRSVSNDDWVPPEMRANPEKLIEAERV